MAFKFTSGAQFGRAFRVAAAARERPAVTGRISSFRSRQKCKKKIFILTKIDEIEGISFKYNLYFLTEIILGFLSCNFA